MKKIIIAVIVFFAGQSFLEAQPYQQLLDLQIAQSKRCMDAVLKKDFQKAYELFTPEMKKEFSRDTFAIFWNLFEKKAGKPYRIFNSRIDIKKGRS